MRFVISNTTEAGIAFDPTCKLEDAPAASYPSLTGTFLMNEILGDKDRIRIEDGAIVTIGATTFILHTAEE
jgi:hypothetical protein